MMGLNRYRILFILSAVIPFFVYLLTANPSVVFFDAGELIVSSFVLSPGHPPGYPLYVLLGKFASFLPFGAVAYKLNIMAAFFSSVSALMVFLITSRLLKGLETEETMVYRDIIPFFTAMALAFSYDFWNQAIIAEVYPMNTFIAGLIIYTLLHWKDENSGRWSVAGVQQAGIMPDSRLLYLSCFLLGLGLGNHHTLLVVLPVLFLIIAVTNWRLFLDARAWGISILFFILGLSVYLFLPVRALQSPPLNWGDPDTLSKFKWVMFREGYPRQGLYRPLALFWKQLKTIDLVYGFSGVGFAIGCLGMVAYAKKRLTEVLVTLTIFFVLSVGICIYGNPVEENIFLIESFHSPTYMIFSVWIGMGMFFILNLLFRFGGSVVRQNAIVPVLVILIAVLPASLLAYFYPWNDRSRDLVAYDYAKNELSSMPSNSILFTWGDSGAFPLWYVQIVERYQPGVLLIHTPHLSTKWYIDELPDSVRKGQLQWIQKDDLYAELAFNIMLRENFGKYPLFIDYSTRYSVPIEGYTSIPNGLIYALSTDATQTSDPAIWGSYTMRGIYEKDPYRDLDTGKAVSIYANTLFDGGIHLLRLNATDEAYWQFGEAAKIEPALKRQVRDIMFGGGGEGTLPEGHP